MRKRYNTPHRSRVVKTRMTEEEYAEFAQRLSAYNMSQAEFIRQAITGAAIRPIITVSPVNDELLAAVGKLTAEYGRIGGNLNQIARTLNEWHSPCERVGTLDELMDAMNPKDGYEMRLFIQTPGRQFVFYRIPERLSNLEDYANEGCSVRGTKDEIMAEIFTEWAPAQEDLEDDFEL